MPIRVPLCGSGSENAVRSNAENATFSLIRALSFTFRALKHVGRREAIVVVMFIFPDSIIF